MSPFHEHEIRMQTLAGDRHLAARTGTIVGEAIPDRARPFLARQEMLVLGTVDRDGLPWASVVHGRPGFISSDPAGTRMVLHRVAMVERPEEIAWTNLEHDGRVGTLAIELATRRRFRANGRVILRSPDRLEIDVLEAYPNCPQYVTRRELEDVDLEAARSRESTFERTVALTREHRDRLAASDGVFVATVNGDGGVDASHRGGDPGFLRLDDEGRIRIPDFPGNGMYNSLGNVLGHPWAGFVAVDHATGTVLQVAGSAGIEVDDPATAAWTGGTGRWWWIRPEQVRTWTTVPRSGAGSPAEPSPFNPRHDGRTASPAR